MEHNQETPVEPINTSSSKFGVQYQNNFVVLDDCKHLIGVDPNDGSKMILENVENGSTVKFEWSKFSNNYVSTLVYEEDIEYLYTGDDKGDLHQYKIDTASETCEKVRNYGDLEIGEITSSHRFMNFVFFGGNKNKIRVLDLSTGELLPGSLKTSIGWIRSLQVCMKSQDHNYLAVSGYDTDYSDNKTDLFDVSGLFLNNPLVLENHLSENEIDNGQNILPQQDTIKSLKETIQKLKHERDFYKGKLRKIQSKNDQLLKHNKKFLEAYKKLKLKFDNKYMQFFTKINILYLYKQKKIIIKAFGQIIENGLFDETDPLLIMTNLMRDHKEKKKR